MTTRDKPDVSLKVRVSALEEKLEASELEVADLKRYLTAKSAASDREIAKLTTMLLELSAKLDVTAVPLSSPKLVVSGSAHTDMCDEPSEEISLPFSEPFVEGLFKYLGKTDGTVEASMSSVFPDYGSHPDRFLGHTGDVTNWTKAEPHSWMEVDIGKSRAMQVSTYCLRHGTGSGGADSSSFSAAFSKGFKGGGGLIHWKLQASNSGKDVVNREWDTLSKHMEEKSLSNKLVASWPIESSKSYRYFRILQTGKNSGGGYSLRCSGIELYGTLKRKR